MTAAPSAAADTLRDEVAEAIGEMPEARNLRDVTDEYVTVITAEVDLIADAVLPVVLAYADAREAEVRERIAADLREVIEATLYDGDSDRPLLGYDTLLAHADHIAGEARDMLAAVTA